MLLGKDVLKTCNKFTGEHPCRSAISIKLLLNFIEITLRHRCSPVNLLHIFRTPFLKNTSEWLLQSLFRTLLPHPVIFAVWWEAKMSLRSCHPELSVRIVLLRNFKNITGKHRWQSLFFNKVTGWCLDR